MKLTEAAVVIRSKNSGPYELTLDVIFREEKDFLRAKETQLFNRELVAELYRISPGDVLAIIDFAPAKAYKINIRRPVPAGGLGDTDVYGAQQHAPLLALELK